MASANNRFKVDNGLIASGNAIFYDRVDVQANAHFNNDLFVVSGNLVVNGSLIYSDVRIGAGGIFLDADQQPLGNTSNRFNAFLYDTISYGTLKPDANGGALGTTTERWQVFANNITVTNTINFPSSALVNSTIYTGTAGNANNLFNLSTNGIIVRTGVGNGVTRTITGTNSITVANGDGVSGNPTISFANGTGLFSNTLGVHVDLGAVTTGTLSVARGGTGGNVNNLLPTQSAGTTGYVLASSGASATLSWQQLAGPTGPQGAQGVQGAVGLTGAQGVQGPVGPQGPQGPQGFQGVQGSVGGSGLTGSQGPQGFQGVQGPIGPQGPQGPQGFQGVQGQVGAQGAQGRQGAQGPQGFQGVQGSQGFQGVQGAIGAQGPQGFQGVQGPQGRQGADGNFGGATFKYTFSTTTTNSDPGTGTLRLNNATVSSATAMYIDDTDTAATDIQSFLRTIDDSTSTIKGHFRISNRLDANDFALFTISSITENTGYFTVNCAFVSGSAAAFTNAEDIIITFARTGDKGDVGAQGPQGFQGVQGPQGFQGVQGPQGFQGVQGPIGVQGPQGPQGFQGVQGPQGFQGVQGPQGRQGVQGPQGFQGVQGPQGFQGVQGPQGFQGVQGPQGFQGVQGAVGAGPQGPQGPQGVQGPQGFQGVQGAVGAGPQGPQGVQGPQGFQGVQGPQGRQGVQGAVGAGPQGPQGVQGPQGRQGAIGPIAGSNTQVVFNDSGVANGSSSFTFNKTNGNVTASDFVIASDATLKNIIGNIPNALDIINSLDGIKYTWNALGQELLGHSADKVELGVIAQQIEKELPELIAMSVHGDYKMVAYARIVAVLIEAVKELSIKVDALENK